MKCDHCPCEGRCPGHDLCKLGPEHTDFIIEEGKRMDEIAGRLDRPACKHAARQSDCGCSGIYCLLFDRPTSLQECWECSSYQGANS